MTTRFTSIAALVFSAAACTHAPAPRTAPSPQRSTAQGALRDSTRAPGDSARGGAAPAQPRPYNRVIT
ncbi:MAG TPA: hypothetical protein VD758_08550, partial [Gemmatimonadaceae bacterium]|nr:hypothetical protein [Gemmatimonadaceae bacterium]